MHTPRYRASTTTTTTTNANAQRYTHVTNTLTPDRLVKLHVDAHIRRLHRLLRKLFDLSRRKHREVSRRSSFATHPTPHRPSTAAKNAHTGSNNPPIAIPRIASRRISRRRARADAGVALIASRVTPHRNRIATRTAATARGARFLNVIPVMALPRLIVYSRVTTSAGFASRPMVRADFASVRGVARRRRWRRKRKRDGDRSIDGFSRAIDNVIDGFSRAIDIWYRSNGDDDASYFCEIGVCGVDYETMV